MCVLGILIVGTLSAEAMRPMYLVLLVLAVILLLAGCSIALVTLRNQRKGQLALITSEHLDNEEQ